MSTKSIVFIVEDDRILLEAIVEHLRGAGISSEGFLNADELDEHLNYMVPSILILDINLPGENGFQIAKRIRACMPDLIIIMMSDLKSESRRLHGYETGADIFFPKPVVPAELLAVIKSCFRRLGAPRPISSTVNFYFSNSTLEFSGKQAVLNSMEKHLLMALVQAERQMLPTWKLLDVISIATGVCNADKPYLEMQIFRLRKKFQYIGAPVPSIKAVWKEGYILLLRINLVNS